MYAGFYEEGDRCPGCGEAKLVFPKAENCSCHINPPCLACTSVVLTCPKCKWEDEPEPFHYVSGGPGITMVEYRPRPLDKTKIDYRSKGHTHFSMLKEGVYPDGATRDEVEKVVRGTFGGRFTQFGDGKFTYIAYTD